MLPQFLIPETSLNANGHGPAVALGSSAGSMLQLTLSIRRVIEQESLDISIEGSVDGETWLERPLAHFPQKFYCGDYSILCDLRMHPAVRHIRAVWKAHRWGRGTPEPFFDVFLFVEEAKQLASAAGR
jgi:hypothetical protein